MPDPKFDKQVQEKMEELKFSPSPAVWKNLEATLDQDKRRRKPLFWFFLFAGIGLGSALFYLGANHRHTTFVQQTARTAVVPSDHTVSGSSDHLLKATPTTKEPAEKISSAAGASIEKITATNSSMIVRKDLKNNFSEAQSLTSKHHHKKEQKNNHEPIEADAVQQALTQQEAAKNESARQHDAIDSSAKDLSNQTPVSDMTMNAADTAAGLPKKINVSPVRNVDSAVTEAKKKTTVPHKGWKFGLMFSLGMSAQQSALFTNANYQMKSFSSMTAFAVPAAIAPVSPTSVLSFRPSFSWAAGLALRRNISRRWDLSGGIHYHYSSTTITASALAINTSSSLFYNSAYGNKLTEYRNSFHFIDIPLAVGYTVNTHGLFPVRLEGGLVVSEFLSGKGLQYANGNTYYAKYNSLNKTQVAASFGVQVGWVNGRNLFEIGPQIQYGLTDLLRVSGVSNQHLLFGGLTFRVMRTKK